MILTKSVSLGKVRRLVNTQRALSSVSQCSELEWVKQVESPAVYSRDRKLYKIVNLDKYISSNKVVRCVRDAFE